MITCAIWMVTYNHEQFISQAIESILSQKTDFPFKLFIGEDKSTDKTRDICLEYARNYPDLIELDLNEYNIGGMRNAKNIYEKCFNSGAAYVAMLEGDDFWCDDFKLQKQVEFLQSNNDFTICFHRVLELVSDGSTAFSQLNTSDKEEIYTIEDLATGNFIHTPSVVFRNTNLQFPEWFIDSPVGDYVLHMLNARDGKIKYFAEAMAVYRIHQSSNWSSMPVYNRYNNWVKLLDILQTKFSDTVNDILKRQKFYILQQIAGLYLLDNNIEAYKDVMYSALMTHEQEAKKWLAQEYLRVLDQNRVMFKAPLGIKATVQHLSKQIKRKISN